MKFGSVCSGIGTPEAAWIPLGWEGRFLSEIEAFPCSVLSKRFPNTPNFGDMTKFKEWPDVPDLDVLIGGTPCQSFSVAGLRKGLADPRGNLALTFLAILDRFRPRWVVWENVPGVLSSTSDGAPDPTPPKNPLDMELDGQEVELEDSYSGEEVHAFNSFLAGLSELGYGWTYRVLDAQYFGVAQRRRRVFVVGHLGNRAASAAVLLERASLSGNPPPRRQSRQNLARTAEDRLGSGGGVGAGDRERDGGAGGESGLDVSGVQRGELGDMVPDMRVVQPRTGEEDPGAVGIEFGPGENGFTDVSPTLDSRAKDGPIRNQSAAAALTKKPWADRGSDENLVVEDSKFAKHRPDPSRHTSGAGQAGAEILTDLAPTLNCNHEAPYAAIPDVAHTLKGEGFDASEDGTGRGTPLVAVIQDGRDMKKGQNGLGISEEDKAYTLDRTGSQAIALRVHGENSQAMQGPGDAAVAGPTDLARALDTTGGYTSGQGGNVVLQPIAFDTTQVTSKANRSNPKPGDPCHPVVAGGHAPAIAFSAGDHGGDALEECSPTIRKGGDGGGNQPAVVLPGAVGFNSDQSEQTRSMGEREEESPTLRAGGEVSVAYAFEPGIAAREGGHAYEEISGTLRKDPGDNQMSVAMAFQERGRDGGRNVEVMEELSPALTAPNGGGRRQEKNVLARSAVRRLTPRECERLQGFPDDWTLVEHRGKDAADGPRYKGIGNAMARPVIEWLGRRIEAVDRVLASTKEVKID